MIKAWEPRRSGKSIWIIAVVFLGAVPIVHANEPEKLNVFEAGQGGYAIYRIPGLVVTSRGTVLAYGEARRGGGDWAEIDVLMRRSTDGGRTWGPPIRVSHDADDVPPSPVAPKTREGNGRTAGNPVAIADAETGAVHLLYCVEYGHCFYRRSDDDGLTFSPPVEINAAFEAFRPEYDWKVLATGPGHGVQLATGRLVVAVWLSTAAGRNAHHPSVTATIYSDDHGKTWRRGAIAARSTAEHPDPNEAAIVALADDRVMLNIRNESPARRRLVTISADGASGWSTPTLVPDLPEPVCMGSLALASANPATGRERWLLFANPDHPELLAHHGGGPPPKGWSDRKNLAIKLSTDDGKTWPTTRTLEPGPSAYSDLAVLPDGTILCFYERPQAHVDRPARTGTALTLARFSLDWLMHEHP